MIDWLATTFTALHNLTVVDRYSAFVTAATALAFELLSGSATRAGLRRSFGEFLNTAY
jgi:hypothetical protein